MEEFTARQNALYGSVPPVDFPKTGELSGHELGEHLSRYAGYLTWLDAEVGRQEGKCYALKELYKVKLSIARSEWASVPSSKMAEQAKEDAALAKDPELVGWKKRWAEEEGLLLTGKGLLDSYQNAYTAISRQIELRKLEAGIALSKLA
jgi:hypothetical protein